MTLHAIARLIRHQWVVLSAGLLLGVVGATVIGLLIPRTYESSTSVYLSTASAEGDVALDAQSATLAQQRAASYSQFLTSTRLAGEVDRRLRLGMPDGQIAEEITVSTAPESAVLTATVRDSSPARAQSIANGVGGVFVDLVAQFEQPRDPSRPPTITARTLDPATYPDRPVAPDMALVVGLGVILGGLLGVVAALVRRSATDTIGDAVDLEAALDEPVLARFPLEAPLEPRTVSSARSRDTPAAEGYRRLRTVLDFRFRRDPATVLTVMSPRHGEGRTTTALHLALALHEDGRAVCVVEADLRSPVIAGLVGVAEGPGLADVLGGSHDTDSAMQSFGGGVGLLVAGSPPGNPAELLGSPTMDAVISQLRGRYDTVLIDTPPAAELADAPLLASRTDAVLAVVRTGLSRRHELRAMCELLHAGSAPVVGSVMVDAHRQGGAAALAAAWIARQRDRRPWSSVRLETGRGPAALEAAPSSPSPDPAERADPPSLSETHGESTVARTTSTTPSPRPRATVLATTSSATPEEPDAG